METWNQRFARALAESEYNMNKLRLELGVSAPTVSGWAAAGGIKPIENISGENLLKVCRLLNVRPEWLLFREGPMRPPPARKLTPEMLAVVEALEEIDRSGGTEREDALYFMNRLLRTSDRPKFMAGSS